jgi:muramoyltetrapeptide carboxypeptidase
MYRRSFTHWLAGLVAFSGFSFSIDEGAVWRTAAGKRRLLKPRRLRRGDTIGVITPGSPISDEELGKAVENLESLGFIVKMGRHVRAEKGFIAGSDAQRLEDMHDMFADPRVAAIWCARGGYGCSRLLPAIDYTLIRRNPKALIGYSDITALLQAAHRQTGLVGFHGPNAGSDFTDYVRAQIESVLMRGESPHRIALSQENERRTEQHFQPFIIRGGRARGPLGGGNLCLLAAMAGTPFAFDAAGKIVFLEDIGEKPYRVDRMMTQLRQGGNLDKAAAIAYGVFLDCEANPNDKSLSLAETLTAQNEAIGVPAAYAFPFGHIPNQCVLPLGIMAEVDTVERTLTLLESAVTE